MKRGPTGFSSWLELKDPEIDPGLFHSHGVMPSKAKAEQGKAAWRSKASVTAPTRARRSSPKARFRKLAQYLGACPHRMRQRSSSYTTSRTQCNPFSICQWPRRCSSSRRASACCGVKTGNGVSYFSGGLPLQATSRSSWHTWPACGHWR
jgi:hypothetical protein